MKNKRPFPMLALAICLLWSFPVYSQQNDAKETETTSPPPAATKANPLLSTGTRFVPVFVSVRLARQMKPETVAAISSTIPVERAVAITKELDRDFVTEVTRYLDPVKGAPIIEKCPDDLSIDVVKRLIKKGDAKVASRLGDRLSPAKLISLSKGLTVQENVQVGYYMVQKALITKVLAANTDGYLIELLNDCIRHAYYKLIADVSQEMDTDRTIRLLNQLSMTKDQKTQFLATITHNLSPVKSSEIIEKCPDQVVADVVNRLISDGDSKLLGVFSDNLSRKKLVAVSRLLTTRQKIQVGYHMTKRRLIAEVLSDYSDPYLIELLNETAKLGYYSLVASIIEVMKPERTKRVLAGLTDNDLIKLLEHYDGARFAQVIQSMDRKVVREFSITMKSEKMAVIVNRSPPSVINIMWPFISDEKKLEVIPLVDLDMLPHIWPELNRDVKNSLSSLSKRYEPLAAVMKTLSGSHPN